MAGLSNSAIANLFIELISALGGHQGWEKTPLKSGGRFLRLTFLRALYLEGFRARTKVAEAGAGRVGHRFRSILTTLLVLTTGFRRQMPISASDPKRTAVSALYVVGKEQWTLK